MLNTDKAINLAQLQGEMVTAGVDVGQGLGMFGTFVFPYYGGSSDIGQPGAQPGEFTDPAGAQACIDAHVAMRDKTDDELAADFNAADATPARKQDIRDQMAGLIPREQVPMDAVRQ